MTVCWIIHGFQFGVGRCLHVGSSVSMSHVKSTVVAGSPGSRGSLGALMTCLRAARAHGVDHPDQEGFWGGLVSLSLLQQALVHKHDQVGGKLW